MPAAVPLRQADSHAVARALRVAPITHLASGGIVGAGAAVLQMAIAEEVQALDPSVTPYVGVSLQRVGSAPPLLAATGTVALLSDDEEPETLAALRSVVQTPLDTDAASLALPLAAGHAFRLEEATVGVTGAAGDWGSANQWLLKVNSGGGSASARVLSSAVLDEAAARTLTLPGSTRLFNSSLSPLLTLSADARGNAPELLSLQATARLKAWRLANSVTFTYDPNGSVISEVTDEEVLTYAWDPSDRLVGVARDAEPVAAYAYDAGGRRVAATTDAGTTNYLWDEQNLLAELDDALATLAQYTDYPGVWGGLSSVHAGGASAFFAPDLSSNVRLLLNAAGGVQQASLYGAFGVPLAGATASPLGFGGGLGYFDDGLDRLYVRARHYRPGLGAWMSRDPLGGLLGGYGYVANSPVEWVDPSGLYVDGPVGQEGRDLVYDAMSVKGIAKDVTQMAGRGIRDNWTTVSSAVLAGPSVKTARGLERLSARGESLLDALDALEGQADAATEASGQMAHEARAARAAATAAESEALHLRRSHYAYKGVITKRRTAGGLKLKEAEDAAEAARNAALRAEAVAVRACDEAVAAEARAASSARSLNTAISRLLRFGGQLGRIGQKLEQLLTKLKWISGALSALGGILAVVDLYKAVEASDRCMDKADRCNPLICYTPLATSLCEIAAVIVPLFFPPAAVNSVIGGLACSVLSSAVTGWLFKGCFS